MSELLRADKMHRTEIKDLDIAMVKILRTVHEYSGDFEIAVWLRR